jgi:hypothetical protein
VIQKKSADVSEEHQLTLTALHSFISQKINSTTTAVRTSDPTYSDQQLQKGGYIKKPKCSLGEIVNVETWVFILITVI